jgi:hypothetical protein
MTKPRCPHCDQPLLPFSLPEAGGWEAPFHVACFNDDCPYYRNGWEHMEKQYGVKASYRFRIDPASNQASPLPVWSPDAFKSQILDADVTAEETTEDAETGGSEP